VINCPKWPNAGIVKGPSRNVAWRVLDAKYFGLPQQRRRLYVLAGGKDFHPENVLFEKHSGKLAKYPQTSLVFSKDGHEFEVFREYTDCLYSAYGTKWNGNAAANNGSLFVVQDKRIRRLSPLECERLMGFPDHYTNLDRAKKTNRYQATGNSWAVPVVRWIGERLTTHEVDTGSIVAHDYFTDCYVQWDSEEGCYFNFGKDIVQLGDGTAINCTAIPENSIFGHMKDIVSPDAPEDIYISPTGCFGIVRRSRERRTSINERLKEVLLSISSEWSEEAIEKRSRVQKRGRFSVPASAEVMHKAVTVEKQHSNNKSCQLSLFDIMQLQD
jgi:DNA (cytosine-5)-methyltransferase 1